MVSHIADVVRQPYPVVSAGLAHGQASRPVGRLFAGGGRHSNGHDVLVKGKALEAGARASAYCARPSHSLVRHLRAQCDPGDLVDDGEIKAAAKADMRGFHASIYYYSRIPGG